MTKTSLSTTTLTVIAAFPRDTALAISSPPTCLVAPPATFDHSPPTLIAPSTPTTPSLRTTATTTTTAAAISMPPASSTPTPSTPTPPPTAAAAAFTAIPSAPTLTPSTAAVPTSRHLLLSAPPHVTTSTSTPACPLSKSNRPQSSRRTQSPPPSTRKSCKLFAHQSKGGMTPLHRVSLQGHVHVAQLLIEHGADATTQSKDGTTPLHGVSESGHVDVAR